MLSLRVAPSGHVICQAVQDELIILDLKSQQYFGLDNVGSDMWKLLVEHGDAEVAADLLSREYSADRETVRKDLTDLIARLLAMGLMEQVEAPRATPKENCNLLGR